MHLCAYAEYFILNFMNCFIKTTTKHFKIVTLKDKHFTYDCLFFILTNLISKTTHIF